MKKTIEQRLDKLEREVESQQHRVTRIEIVCAETGEVGAVMHVGGQPDQEGVMQALKFKHETDPPREVWSRSID